MDSSVLPGGSIVVMGRDVMSTLLGDVTSGDVMSSSQIDLPLRKTRFFKKYLVLNPFSSKGKKRVLMLSDLGH